MKRNNKNKTSKVLSFGELEYDGRKIFRDLFYNVKPVFRNISIGNPEQEFENRNLRRFMLNIIKTQRFIRLEF